MISLIVKQQLRQQLLLFSESMLLKRRLSELLKKLFAQNRLLLVYHASNRSKNQAQRLFAGQLARKMLERIH